MPKFKRLDEVSFTLKGHKLYAIVKGSQPTNVDGDNTFIYELVLVQPIKTSIITYFEVQCIEEDLTLEKFPLEAATREPLVID